MEKASNEAALKRYATILWRVNLVYQEGLISEIERYAVVSKLKKEYIKKLQQSDCFRPVHDV